MPLTLTIDVEGWAQSTLDHDMPITGRAKVNMEHLLDVLNSQNRQATCFVLGKFAELFPDIGHLLEIWSQGRLLVRHGIVSPSIEARSGARWLHVTGRD